MGYTTNFEGRIEVTPPLNEEEVRYLTKFNETRRMDCEQGPYYVGRGGFMGQDHTDPKVRDFNAPPQGQPGLWCKWRPTEDGTAIVWDGGEKFYDSAEWMRYLIEHFLKPGCRASAAFGELVGTETRFEGHTLNGVIRAQGEDPDDQWELVVEDNRVTERMTAATGY